LSKISETKMKEGIFFGPQITQQFEDQDFSAELNSTERRAMAGILKRLRKLARQ
jgi:hypothetical protein